MGVPGLIRLATLAVIGLVLLFCGGCATARPHVADETKVEEWGRCRAERAKFTVLCLEMRRPL
jgi:hypothetical protein